MAIFVLVIFVFIVLLRRDFGSQSFYLNNFFSSGFLKSVIVFIQFLFWVSFENVSLQVYILGFRKSDFVQVELLKKLNYSKDYFEQFFI